MIPDDNIIKWTPTLADTGSKKLIAYVHTNGIRSDSIIINITVLPPLMVSFLKTESSVKESDQKIKVTAKLNRKADKQLAIDIVADGDSLPPFFRASNPLDYKIDNQEATLQFSPGTDSAYCFVEIIPDTASENDEKFNLRFKLPGYNPGYRIGSNPKMQITILDDDTCTLTLDKTTFSVDEKSGILSFKVSLSKPFAAPIDIVVDARNSEAKPGEDFTIDTDTLKFSDSKTVDSIVIKIIHDHTKEKTEKVTLALRCSNKKILLADSIIEGTITNKSKSILYMMGNENNQNDTKIISWLGTRGFEVFKSNTSPSSIDSADMIVLSRTFKEKLNSISNKPSICMSVDNLNLCGFVQTVNSARLITANVPFKAYKLTFPSEPLPYLDSNDNQGPYDYMAYFKNNDEFAMVAKTTAPASVFISMPIFNLDAQFYDFFMLGFDELLKLSDMATK